VIAFARDAASRPELWLDFPLLPDDADSDGLWLRAILSCLPQRLFFIGVG
jgi:hypothetical protein